MGNKVYKRGVDFPNEGFVQKAIEKYFLELGCERIKEEHTDFVCFNPKTNEKWVIEAKGKSACIGLDFRTCIGQLIQRMDEENNNYAIAIPDIPQYHNQCKMVKEWIRKKLNVFWIFVDGQGEISIYSPSDKL